jgi:tRNA dimethylallyltransferase
MPATPADFGDAVILTGPTGSGKTALALNLAEYLNAEIIVCDSMTLYRGMDIGTAKPSLADRARVPHHLVDVINPWESVSVAWWLDQASEAVRQIRARGKVPLIVGGTPFYLKALLYGLFDSPPADQELRRKLEAEAERHGVAALHAKLAKVDPAAAQKLHPNDVRRVVRALEVYELTGQPLSEQQTQWSEVAAESKGALAPPAVRDLLCLDIPRDELYSRINRRVEQMVEAGWLDEVRRLAELPHPLSREASQALGYCEMKVVSHGKTGLVEAVALIQQKTRQFAKRQMTWFRHLPGLRMVSPELTFDHWRLRIQA